MKTLHIPMGAGPSSGRGAFSWGSASDLPVDVLERARFRLATLAGLLAGVEILILLAVYLGPIPDRYQPRSLALNLEPIALMAGISGLVAILAGLRVFPLRTILTKALAYQVVVCWLTSLAMTRGELVAFGHLPVITWTTPLILLFPFLIPAPPRWVLTAGILSAATGPGAVGYLVSNGEVEAGFATYVFASLSPALAVILAFVGAKLVYRISREVVTAREMGSYRLESTIGRGGMGEVWRASHSMLARPAAVKLIRPEMLGVSDSAAAQSAMERFEREAQVTANLKSSHTIELYDFGRADDGTFYYVMELLDGLSLENLIVEYGPLSPQRAVYLLLQVCHSLEEAHREGLVHRDIKPANVFVCRQGLDFDYVKVLDFGLVKGDLKGQGDDVKLTAGNVVVGTPAFMAPEMALGGTVDARTDLYAVGCLAYWMLSGRFVFEGDTPMAIALAHAKDEPVSVSEYTEVDIPGDLDALILRCLEKEQGRRPTTAEELARELDRLAFDSTWSERDAETWWRSHNPDTSFVEPKSNDTVELRAEVA